MRARIAPAHRRLLWSRWLVLALLSLMLPLQGALAATMALGMALMPATPGPAHTMAMSMAMSTAMPSACADMGEMDHSVQVSDQGSHHGHALASAGDAASGDDHAGADHHCGICLQCCIGAALPMASLPLAEQNLRDAAPTRRTAGAPDQPPQALDRPPKTFLA
ncbi:hypothetical protein [Roseateles amylovorans]|uniref:DUF2946 domain-containing protein n=1 Tax=Roseateles amylovorans TaxID=2978473 RepID=A0ABY6B2I0_9BURK|nr:hypothetical protein [Roseateles amylovorans]UXH79286.1 hypothetical protein N4261_04950 [Roseateles amylovorans]